jgi:hypothetical protein
MPVNQGSIESVKSTTRAIEEKGNDHQTQKPINKVPAVRGDHGCHFESAGNEKKK